ncbi:BTB/POZ domain-containing protein 6-B-like [Mytilus galloprovincialis]|uniref:BTB/POZ domain-containing protein 6-B-like n=1 Tax=Mytilus galloprovincialis TaxID=29158 RepID=UPI003F7BC05F
MMYMLQNEIMCDVTFRVGHERTSIKAHKFMLSSRSAVFHTMFEGSLPEKGEITISDIDDNTFRDILKYFYSDDITITNNNVKEMLYAADKYMLAAVKRKCETVLKQTAQSEHATKALQTGYQYHLLELQKESLDYIEMHTKACLLSEHAVTLSKDCLELILKSDFLDCSETDICQFILKWGKHQCELAKLEPSGGNMREAIGNILYLIRFPNVEMKFFSKAVANSCILTSDEMVSIYQSHFGETSKAFPRSLRVPVSKRQIYSLNRYGQITGPMGSSGIQSLTFHSDKEIWLKGVNIFPPFNQYAPRIRGDRMHCFDPGTVSISIKVLNDSKEETFQQQKNINLSRNGGQVQQIDFCKPVRVTSIRDYTIVLDGITHQHFYGTDCQESVTDQQSGVTIMFKNSPADKNGTNINSGQFAGLLFSV